MHPRDGAILSVAAVALLFGGCKVPSLGEAPLLTALLPAADHASPSPEEDLLQPASKADQPKELPPPSDDRPPEKPAKDAAATPLTLEDAIAHTFRSNPDLQSAEARERIAEAALARARVEFFPTLALNESYQVSNNLLRRFQFLFAQGVQTNVIPPVADNFQSELHANWDVYTGGLRLARSRAAAADTEASHYALAAVQEHLAYLVAEAYYHLFQAIALREVRQESVEQAESQLRDVQSRVRANTATRADVFQVESYLTEAQVALITATNQVRLSWALLENLVGTHLTGYVMPATLPPPPWGDHAALVDRAAAQSPKDRKEQPGDEKELEESVASALRERPEVGEGTRQQEAAKHRVRAAEAGRYPTVNAFADYDHFTGTGSMSDSYFIGVAASLYLFDGSRTKMSVRQAEAEVGRILSHNRRTQLDIELEVRRAHLNRKDARERLNVRSAALRQATENLRQTQSRYDNQAATLTDVLVARVSLANARVQHIQNQADIVIADADLERALGRLTRLLNLPSTWRKAF